MAHADPDLLLGLLALRNRLVDRTALVDAFRALDGQGSLALRLADRGAIDAETAGLLELLTRKHLKLHGGDSRQALRDLVSQPELRAALAELRGVGPGDSTVDHIVTPEAGHGGPVLSASMSADEPADVVASTRPGRPGDRYQILRPHARGNLGQVYVALDTELNREVALKEILEHRVGDGRYRDRFLVEAEITGQLQHPGIVPVYGLGTYADGRPYYAMRFIRGGSLKDAIDRFHRGRSPDPGPAETATDSGTGPGAEGGLDLASADRSPRMPPYAEGGLNRDEPQSRSVGLRRLLRRFQDVCNAVDYAHSRGVLHRDLKPANIVVGRHGETLVVDWGLAKATGRSDDPAGADEPPVDMSSGPGSGSETQPGRPLGTPAYASPEQLTGALDRLGPATDVYGLGAILYHLLTGQVPFQGGDLATVIRAVQAGQLPAPRAIDPSIPKPLEAVCLKAMALRPEARYATAHELGEDVERWLADEPVRARPEPLPERLRRWGRRHRTAVAAVAVGLVMAVLGLGTVSAVQTRSRNQLAQQNVLLDQQRQRAESRERQAIEAVGRFRDVIVKEPRLKDTPELEELRKRLLSEPLAFFRTLRLQLENDRETRPVSLQRLAGVGYELGGLFREIGEEGDALAAYESTLAIQERLASDHPSVTEYQADLARSHDQLGLLLAATGHSGRALESLEAARAIRERVAGTRPSSTDSQADLAASHNNVGLCLSATGRLTEALDSHGLALVIQARLATAHPAVAVHQEDLATSHSNLGILLRRTGRITEALKSYQEALAIRERLAADHPDNDGYQTSLAASYHNLGLILGATGRPDQAIEALKAARAIQDRLTNDHPAVTVYRAELATIQNSLGLQLSATGRTTEALDALREARTLQKRLADEHPTVAGYWSSLAASDDNLGAILAESGHPTEALAPIEAALEIRESLARAHPEIIAYQVGLATGHNNLGSILELVGHPAGAIRSYEAALTIRERLVASDTSIPDHSSHLACTLHNLAKLDLDAGRPESARDRLLRAIDCQRRALRNSPRDPDYRSHLINHLTLMVRAAETLDRVMEAGEAFLEIESLKSVPEQPDP